MTNQNLNLWLKKSEKVSGQLGLNPDVVTVFNTLLEWIHQNQYSGACHDTSAAMYVLLAEAGIESSLCIGMVKTPNNKFFDHSWIEINQKIYDASISLQNQISYPPVFASIDLESKQPCNITYGTQDTCDYDDITKEIMKLDLGGYSNLLDENNRKPNLWFLTETIGVQARMKINANFIRAKYSSKGRLIINK